LPSHKENINQTHINITKTSINKKIAFLACCPELAQDLLLLGKIKIGWCMCRIQDNTRPIRCYNYNTFGYNSNNCKNKIESNKYCLKCGDPNHISSNCNNTPKCLSCHEIGHQMNNHKCPLLIEAINKMKQTHILQNSDKRYRK